jgi:glyoxylase-like metal-dependent hydrolase (beta-lactamase superfamily II)
MTSSRADPEPEPAAEPASPDVSLTPDDEAYSHKGLTYPMGRRGPAEGEMIQIASGVGWARLPIPGSLRHINIWILEDGDGVALVDTGLAIDPCRTAWEALFAGPLAGRKVTRVIVTHFHPDHVGLAGWLVERFGVALWMTRGEWLYGRMLASDVRDTPPEEAAAYWRAAGWDEARIESERAKGWGRFASVVAPIPVSYVRLQEGDVVPVGHRPWRVVIGSGHCPEHACLVDEEAGLMIAGDQVLPRITSNVSLSLSEPQADPLGEWLASIEKLKGLPDSLLVLPSHGEPFTGLHARLDALAHGHRDRLDALHSKIETRCRAVDCFGTLFAREIQDNMLGLATGEALAHLRRLEVEGRAVRTPEDGVDWYSAA